MSSPIDLRRLAKKYPKKRAFITGAGSGLGLEFASELARHGWRLGMSDIRPDRLETAAEKIRSLGATVNEYAFDVTDYKAFENAVNDFVEVAGGVDLAINNAGVGCGAAFEELPLEVFRKTVEVNLMGVVHGCYLFVPVMKKQRSGHILNVASAAAFASGPRMSAYNVAKAGVVALSETLKAELYDHRVNISILMPTFIRTNLGVDCLGTPDSQELARSAVETSPVTADEAVKEVLLGVQENNLYIVLPASARTMWRIKRFLPENFWYLTHFELKRQQFVQNRKQTKLTANSG